ncbi:xanthine dehydrogenase molybdopterin binding subunit [Vibrio albus]|uniref:Xanthine dehydrogenase molybdopterin binding subunit n=1 Tax=Vibrio albus TaxID=2200953 RepID=A0A2U3B675_9VIBR|nr:xanthine dehydrogenase molybdopterin binding subunit [Vibrio albus]PWI32303.1 xanthine dehydrogenase molybdopterin binding subunit [Vibrio albus]
MREITYPSQVTPSSLHSDDDKSPGYARPHESAEKHTTGEAHYVDDLATPPGCLHGAIILSEISKGEVKTLDLSAVVAVPGVVAVYTNEDIPGRKDIGTIYEGDPLLCDGEVKFHHQPIALVVANSHRVAWQASQKALITYQEEKPVIHFEDAKKQSPLLPSSRIGTQLTDADFTLGEIQHSGTFSTGGQEHFYLEGQVALAENTEDGGIFLYSSSQNPTEVQLKTAQVLNIPYNLVVTDTRRIGGGFGGKETQSTQWACLAALGAFLSQHPVKLRLPRMVDITSTGKRHPFISDYRLSAHPSGEIQSIRINLHALCGCSPDLSPAIVSRAMFHCDNAYYLNRSEVVGHHLKTDTVSNTAFRGFGGPQGTLVIEKIMQDLGIHLGMDSLDIRLNNLYRKGKNHTHYGMEFSQYDDLLSLIKRLESDSDYRQRRRECQHWNKNNAILKKGLALTPVKFGISFTTKHLNQAGALVHIYTDGSVMVSQGGVEMGQGLYTKVRQVVARTLGISTEFVRVTSTRTDKVPNTSATAASSGSDLNGMAAYQAASTIKKRLLAFAREQYPITNSRNNNDQATPSPDLSDGKLIYGNNTIDWQTLIQEAYLNRVSLSATGFYKTPKLNYDERRSQGRPFLYFALGAACSEVTIDTLTGELCVDRVDILHDAGNSLNPAIDIGQIEGAFIQGLGWLTCEEVIWNEKDGALLSQSPMNYKIPTIGDYPKQMNISLFDKMNPENTIFHSKGVGEPPFLHAISVWCAIYDAVASISGHKVIPTLNAPATGEHILTACINQRPEIERHDN